MLQDLQFQSFKSDINTNNNIFDRCILKFLQYKLPFQGAKDFFPKEETLILSLINWKEK